MSYISVLITQHFFSSGSKNKNIHPKKLSYASGKGSTKKTSSIFSKESFSYISVNESSKTETIKKLVNLQSLKKKKKTRNTFLKKQNFLIITQNFFSHSVIFFSILNKLLIFIFLQIFVTFTMILLFFFFFSFRKILVSSTTFFFTTTYIYIKKL